MIRKERNKERTEKAWENLYRRLENEGLLQEEKDPVINRFGLYKWAGLAAACLLIFALLFTQYDERHCPLIAQHNEEAFSLIKILDDGSIVYLTDKTLLQYPEHFTSGKRLVRLDGNAFFDIARNLKKPFVIETEEVIIEVLGTAFEVDCKEKAAFWLSVQKGRVKVTLKENKNEIKVDAGQMITLGMNKSFIKKVSDPGRYLRYFEKIRFKDEPLSNVVKAINAQGDTLRLEVSGQAESRKLTASFSNESSESMAKLICQALNLNYSRKGNTLTIYE